MAPYAKTQERITDVILVFIFLNALGFPGSYRKVIGYSAGMTIEYTSFLMQLYLMTVSSGKTIFDIKLISLKKKYLSVYLFLSVLFIGSMITTSDATEQIISCIRVTVTAAFALWIYENIDMDRMLTNLYHAQILFVLASVAFPVFFKQYDIRTASYSADFIGISGVKNVIAEELAFSLIMLILLLKIRKEDKKDPPKLIYLFIGVEVILLLMTHGTGAVFVAVIPIAYICLYNKNTSRLNLGLLYIFGSVLFIFVAITVLPYFTPVLNLFGKDATLTGRVPLWNRLLEVMAHGKSLLGYGYGMFWKDHNAVTMMHAGFAENTFMAHMTSGAHNNLLEMYACNGILGLITLFIAIMDSFGNTKKLPMKNYLFCFSYIIFYMMSGWTERSWSTYEFELLFLFLSMAAGLEWKTQKKEEKESVSSQLPNRNKKPEMLGRYRKAPSR